MTALGFGDTNLLLYTFDSSEPEKQGRAAEWMARLWRERSGRVSYQVLNEFYDVALRKRFVANPTTARRFVRDLLAWSPVPTDPALLTRAWQMQDRFQLSWWDALIVAAASNADCRYLLSEDFQAGQDFDGVLVVNPFLSVPGDLT